MISTRGVCDACEVPSEREKLGGAKGGRRSRRRKPGPSKMPASNTKRFAKLLLGRTKAACNIKKSVFIEVYSGRRSKTAAAAARRGLASLRVCKPVGRVPKRADRPVYDIDATPVLKPGSVATWYLDMDTLRGRDASRKYALALAASGSYSRLVVLTSPPCTPWSPWQAVVFAKLNDMQRGARGRARARFFDKSNKGLQNITFCKSLHKQLRAHAKRKTKLVSLHEQPSRALMPKVFAHGPQATQRVWPYAVGKDSFRASVSGCEVGLMNKRRRLLGKSWTFEVEGCKTLMEGLQSLKCSHDEKHEPTEGSDTTLTETYPPKLATILACGCAL